MSQLVSENGLDLFGLALLDKGVEDHNVFGLACMLVSCSSLVKQIRRTQGNPKK